MCPHSTIYVLIYYYIYARPMCVLILVPKYYDAGSDRRRSASPVLKYYEY
jgi:hypothetical protein